MNEENKRYIAEITVGDDYNRSGSRHRIPDWQVEEVKQFGLKLEISNDKINDDLIVYHYYPCNIIEETYVINVIDSSSITSANTKIETSYKNVNVYDWKEHWC